MPEIARPVNFASSHQQARHRTTVPASLKSLQHVGCGYREAADAPTVTAGMGCRWGWVVAARGCCWKALGCVSVCVRLFARGRAAGRNRKLLLGVPGRVGPPAIEVSTEKISAAKGQCCCDAL